MSYRNPLLATDFSEGADAAARVLSFVLDKGVRGTIAHAVAAPELPPETPATSLADVERRIGGDLDEIRRLLLEWAAKRGLPGWSAATGFGPVGATIGGIAKTRQADLVVVGSHGAGRIERAFLGSGARSVLRHTGIDTLIARGDADRMGQIILATDLQASSRIAARRAHEIAIRNLSEVTILHAIDPGIFAGALYATPPEGRFDENWLKEHVLGGLSRVNQTFFAGRASELAIHDQAVAGIVRKAGELRADLVVVGSHGAGPIERFLLGSVAEGVAANAPCSVLVVRNA